MFNSTTQSLIDSSIQHLTSLGFRDINSGERWERDGVFIVGVTIKDSTASHWYLSVSGTNNDYDPGIDLVLIWAPRHKRLDDVISIDSFDHLTQLLAQYQASQDGTISPL